MNNGNAHQSAWSAEFHAARGNVFLPCPAAELGGHDGDCVTVHPNGITLAPAGGWKATPSGDGFVPPYVESYV
jgi:hypothetical protein